MTFKAPLYHTHWRKPTLKTLQSIAIKFHLQSMDCCQCLALRPFMGFQWNFENWRRKNRQTKRKSISTEYTRKCCPATALPPLQKSIPKPKDHLTKIDPRSLASCPYLTPLFFRRWNKKHCRSTSRGMRTISTYRRIGLPHKSPS